MKLLSLAQKEARINIDHLLIGNPKEDVTVS